jgi:CheY-like chemotaxis protein
MTQSMPKSAAAGTALVLCKDPSTRQLILESLHPLAILPEICEDGLVAASLLDKQKFEAVIADLQLGDEAVLVLRQLRLSRANRTAVTFAITTGNETPNSPRPDSTFVLQRPLSTAAVCQTLRAAFGLVVRERRRYFRCPVEIPAFVRARQPEDLLCRSVNISEGGIAIRVPTALDSEAALVRFNLPGRPGQLFAETRVVWRGPDGLVGLQFQSLPAPQKQELQEWLARRLDDTLPENVAALFRGVGQS